MKAPVGAGADRAIASRPVLLAVAAQGWCGAGASSTIAPSARKTSARKQRQKMQNHLHQNQNQCVEQPNRMLANGPNHPGPGTPEEIPMVDVSFT
ncbi:hypothetical protein CRUP_010244 [Coryphaenoides rupestris]|nr:hypothetical protein CRUP_010244 [Coryphaenoides rupestris]